MSVAVVNRHELIVQNPQRCMQLNLRARPGVPSSRNVI